MHSVTLPLLLGASLARALDPHKDTFSLDAVRRDTSTGNTSRIYVGSDWYIPISIGTPPQNLLFLGDSGAPGFSVGSTLLPYASQPHHAVKYNPNISSTAVQRPGYTYALEYGSGASSSGVVFQDVVRVGNLTVEGMDIETQTRNNHDQENNFSPRAGNLGLNFDMGGQTTKPTRVPTWLQRVVPSLAAGLFTVDFNTHTSTGSFDFGFVDPSKYTGSIGYAPVINGSGEWQIRIAGQVLASNGSYIPSDSFLTVIDTGSPGGGIPRSVADDYFSQVQGSSYDEEKGTYVYPCTASLPDFVFLIGEGEVGWQGRINGSSLGAGSFDGGNMCTQKMEIGASGGGTSLWGQFFIEQFFVVFDWDGARVGFAEKKGVVGSSESSTTTTTTMAASVASTSTVSASMATTMSAGSMTSAASATSSTATPSTSAAAGHRNDRTVAGMSLVGLALLAGM